MKALRKKGSGKREMGGGGGGGFRSNCILSTINCIPSSR